MKCFFKKHQFKRFYDQIVGGIIGRHVICENCCLEYALWWHLEKPHKPKGKTIRIRVKNHEIY